MHKTDGTEATRTDDEGALSPERRRRLREIENQLLSQEADRSQAEFIVKINARLGRATHPAIIARANQRPAIQAAAARRPLA